MPRFPDTLPDPTEEPWWLTATLSELDAAAAVIAAFIDESKEAPSVPPETFTRALALRTLCVDAGAIDAVIERVDEVNDRYRSELRPDGDPARQDAFGKWLVRAEQIANGLLACPALLPESVRAEKGPAVMAFLERTEDHILANISFVVSRASRTFTVKRGPRIRLR